MTDSSELTIADVAKAAGVSVSTVSRILNGKQDVAAATRERVLKMIEQLGYAPHAQAQQLRARKTRNIGLLFPLKYPGNVPYNSLDTDFMVSAAASAGEQNFIFSLLTTPVTKQSLLNLYRSSQVDGLVLMQIYLNDWRVDLLRDHGYPFVMIGHAEDNEGISFIDLDFEGAIMTAFEHLIQSGHKQIGMISLHKNMRENGYGPAVRAWNGHQQIIKRHRIAAHVREASFVQQEVFEATLSLLDEVPDLTAIVTPHANGALSIIQALTERGRRVPEDCSVVGFTSEQTARATRPALTSIDFPALEMGHKAVEMLIKTLTGELDEPEQILIPPKLIIRNTTM
jgi:DNA-binding LacI/PurR family transcriptional regulator